MRGRKQLTSYQHLRGFLADAGAQPFGIQLDAPTGSTLLRVRCIDCGARLSFRDWIAGERLCLGCHARLLASDAQRIAEAERRRLPGSS